MPLTQVSAVLPLLPDAYLLHEQVLYVGTLVIMSVVLFAYRMSQFMKLFTSTASKNHK